MMKGNKKTTLTVMTVDSLHGKKDILVGTDTTVGVTVTTDYFWIRG